MKVPIHENESTTIDAFDNDGKCSLAVISSNVKRSETLIWHELTTMDLGDIIEVDIVDTNEDMTPPSMVRVRQVTGKKKSKLELFREVENDLRERGLL